MDIFCPNKHLILDASTCPKCGWRRPISGTLGKSLWGPVDLLAGLGGESRTKFANMISVGNTLILALRSKEMVGLSLMDGGVLWRVAIPVGKNVVSLCLHRDKALVVFQDTHSLTDKFDTGSINMIDPENGQLTPVWAPPSHGLTAPLFHDGKMLIRTAESKLYCLDQDHPDQVCWQVDLQAWFANQPMLVADHIMLLDGYAMFGECKLVALNVRDGSLTWEKKLSGIPSRALAGNARLVFVLDGRKALLALDAQTGELVWQKALLRLYAPPFADEAFIYLVIRGNEDPQAEDRYLLQCLRVRDAELVWQQPLSARVRLAPLLVDNTLLLAGDDGVLQAQRVDNGEKLWAFPIGKKDDPIQTFPHLVGDHVVLGTYFGKLFAITVKQAPEHMGDPQSYLGEGAFEDAAAAYALQGDYLAAAKLFDEKLDSFEEALTLYENAQAFQEAARLAFEHALYSKALENYRKSDDAMGEADTLLAMGNVEGATKILKKMGEIDRAAQLMEDSGSFKQAAQLYREAGRAKDYVRLITKTMFDISELEKLRASGNYETAAHWSMENNEYLEAAKDFRESGKEHEEFDALKQFVQKSNNQPDPWVWQRLAEIGEGLGDLLTAAEAWLKLDRPEDAGESYQELARSLAINVENKLDNLSTADKDHISDLYKQAARAYHDAGLIENEEHCRHQFRKLQQLPKIIILQVECKGFREMEWNILTLTLQNIGFGRAVDVTFNIGSSRFEIQQASRKFSFNLTNGRTLKRTLNLRPNEGHFGEKVPLEIEWQWKDSRGRTYADKGSVPVQVLRERDNQTSVPVVYQFHNLKNFVQDGTIVNGDRVDQKGDRVTINRGGEQTAAGGVDVKTDSGDRIEINARSKADVVQQPASRTCPQCSRTISSMAKFCVFCQWELPNQTQDQGK
jgi:outer membrane protein assembly factor BamB/tetratricopeptide (TPR) repeat protein